jgi:chromate transporter
MIDLMLAFLKIGAASYGGGWTIVGIIQTEIVGRGWLTAIEFARLVAIAQITPGPVALNAATIVGFRLHGLPGAAVATLSVVAVPISLAIVVSTLFAKASRKTGPLTEALKTGTIGLISMTVWAFAPSAAASWPNAVLAAAAFAVSAFTKINPLWVILGSGVAGSIARVLF